MLNKDIKTIDEVIKLERECGHYECDFDDYAHDLEIIAEDVGITTYTEESILDTIAEKLEAKNMHAELFDGETPYIECTGSIKPVKVMLEKLGVKIKSEFTSSGSDYDSYIIELEFICPEEYDVIFKSAEEMERAKECLNYYYSEHNC